MDNQEKTAEVIAEQDVEIAEDAPTSILDEIKGWNYEEADSQEIGTIEDYIPLVIKNPKLSDLAHGRVFHMIESHGIEWEGEDGDQEPIYKFFSEELYGVEATLTKLVDYFSSGGKLLPVRKRIIMLMGPVGGGKSTISTLLKRGLEEYTDTDDGAVYSIVGCPIHENPLNILPMPFREKLSRDHGIDYEKHAQLCPVCQRALDTDHDGDWRKFRIERVVFAERRRIGIGTFTPSDPKSQDMSELVGSINLSKIGDVGVASDPAAYKFDGELNIANRGVIEMIEMLKCDPKFLYVLLTLAQEQVIKTPRYPLIYTDEIIIAHTNETEWANFMKKPENEALRDRIITVLCPYVLDTTSEIKIYKKEISESKEASGVSIVPRTLDICAMFAVLSRLTEPASKNVDLVKKMKAYNGEEVEGIRPADVKRWKHEAEREGMTGVGSRQIMNAISQAITEAEEARAKINKDDLVDHTFGVAEVVDDPISVDGLLMLSVLIKMIDQDPELPEKEKAERRRLLEMAKDEFDLMAKEDIQKAFCYEFEEEASILFDKYVQNTLAYLSGESIKDLVSGEDVEPDERLMSSIERHLGIGENGKRKFREQVAIRMAKIRKDGRAFDFNMHADLREAITKRIFEERRDTIQITTTALHPDKEKLEELNRVIKRLVEQGYTHYSAARLIKYVGQLLNRS